MHVHASHTVALPRETDPGSMRMVDILARGGISGGDDTAVIATPLESLRSSLRDAIAQRSTGQEALEAHVSDLEARGETLAGEHLERFNELRAAVTAIDEQISSLRTSLDNEERAERSRASLDDLVIEPVVVPGTQTPARGVAPAGGARVNSEPRTYGPDARASFFADMYRARYKSDGSSLQRLQRHDTEARVDGWHPEARDGGSDPERRDVGTSAFGALVVPQYLTELYAPNLQNGRPTLDNVRDLPLPDDGMTLNIPRGTTATTVAAQATENSAVSETNFDETTLAVSVRTFAGQQDISRQALERGTNVDTIIFADLAEAYAAAVGSSAINDDGTSGTHLGILATSGINAVTYTDASPTVAEFMPKLFDGVQQVLTNRKMAATGIVMHPRRWGWLLAAVDTTNRPLVIPAGNGPQNVQGTANPNAATIVGSLAGLPVIADPNVPTNLGGGANEDRVIIARLEDILFMEESTAPRQVRFDDVGSASLTVKLVAFAFSAFTAGRYPVAISVISGSGLVTPTF